MWEEVCLIERFALSPALNITCVHSGSRAFRACTRTAAFFPEFPFGHLETSRNFDYSQSSVGRKFSCKKNTVEISEISLEKEKTLWSDVSKLINFSMFIIYFAIGLVVAAFGYLYFIDPKKAIRTLAGIGIFTVFMVLIYVFSEGDGGSDMKLASTAINATIILTSIAILGWIGGSLVKFIK